MEAYEIKDLPSIIKNIETVTFLGPKKSYTGIQFFNFVVKDPEAERFERKDRPVSIETLIKFSSNKLQSTFREDFITGKKKPTVKINLNFMVDLNAEDEYNTNIRSVKIFTDQLREVICSYIYKHVYTPMADPAIKEKLNKLELPPLMELKKKIEEFSGGVSISEKDPRLLKYIKDAIMSKIAPYYKETTKETEGGEGAKTYFNFKITPIQFGSKASESYLYDKLITPVYKSRYAADLKTGMKYEIEPENITEKITLDNYGEYFRYGTESIVRIMFSGFMLIAGQKKIYPSVKTEYIKILRSLPPSGFTPEMISPAAKYLSQEAINEIDMDSETKVETEVVKEDPMGMFGMDPDSYDY